MLTDGGFVKLSGTSGLTRAGKALTDVWGRRIGNRFWDVLFNSLFYYNKDNFSVLARARTSFHLSALEATFIKSLNPLLCKQNEFVYSLKIS